MTEINANNLWGQVYMVKRFFKSVVIVVKALTSVCRVYFQQIRRDSINHGHTTNEASKPENRHLNRYRDVYPYDHSRIVIHDCEETDYINASLVQVRNYSKSHP